jgi:hypothetical protein
MKQRQLGPTITVTVAPLATRGHRVRSEVKITAAAIMRDEELFIAPIFEGEILTIC